MANAPWTSAHSRRPSPPLSWLLEPPGLCRGLRVSAPRGYVAFIMHPFVRPASVKSTVLIFFVQELWPSAITRCPLSRIARSLRFRLERAIALWHRLFAGKYALLAGSLSDPHNAGCSRPLQDCPNRLVTGELEARWNKALAHVAESRSRSRRIPPCPPLRSLRPRAPCLASALKTACPRATNDARLEAHRAHGLSRR